MTYNQPSTVTSQELHELAVAALVREWGISEEDARAALARVDSTEHRRRRRIA